MNSLKERFSSYEAIGDAKLPKRLPVIIVLNGRGFRKTTSLLEKPHSDLYAEMMGQCLIRLISEIEGCVLTYSFNDEIIIVCRNDQTLDTEAWYDNHVQKIISATSSLASIAFYKASFNLNSPLVGEPIFTGKTFILPSLQETVNYLIYKQNQSSRESIHLACYYELFNKYKSYDENFLSYKTPDEKLSLLINECGKNLSDYPICFWRGIACYRVLKRIKHPDGDFDLKKKITIDTELPLFSSNQEFLFKILND